MAERLRRRREGGGQEWWLAVLPAFPLLLLVLRLYYLSRQDVQTMLVLVQFVNPLGLVSSFLITLTWAAPAAVLGLRLAGNLLRASIPDGTPSWLVRASQRTPRWVVVLMGLLAVLVWQLRFLPTLSMLLVASFGLEVLAMRPRYRWIRRGVVLVVPAVAAAALYTWLGPAIAAADRDGDTLLLWLLALPPAVTPLLVGRLPAPVARPLLHAVAAGGALLAVLLVSVIFLRVPVLPTVAVQLAPEDGAARVLVGEVITVDDTTTTLLDADGVVLFLPNSEITAKVLCTRPGPPPSTRIHVRGWQVEQTLLSRTAPRRPPAETDTRCLGRVPGPDEKAATPE